MKQLIVQEGTLVYRWFAWSLKILRMASIDDAEHPPKDYLSEGTNLCHMMRVLLIWAPLAIAFNFFTFAFWAFVLVVWPIYRLGVPMWSWYSLAYAVVALLGCFIYWIATRPKIEVNPTPNRAATISSLILASVVAQKQKICPFISFRRNS